MLAARFIHVSRFTVPRPRLVANMATVADAPPPHKTKLHGRAFYESLGSPKYILAPMVAQSEYVGGYRHHMHGFRSWS